jgi:PKD repeat protein
MAARGKRDLAGSRLTGWLLGCFLAFAVPAWAGVVYQDLGTAAPPASLGGWTMTAYSPSVQGAIPNGTDVYSIPGGPISGFPVLSDPVNKRTIGSGWATWSHGYTGPVFFRGGDTLTLTLPINTRAFLFYVEPDNFGIFNFTVTTDSGTSSGSVGVNGTGGARGFGFYTAANDSIVSITIAADPAAAGFAIGEFSIARAAAIQFVNLGTGAPPAHLGTYDMFPFSVAAQAAVADSSLVTSIPGSPVPGSIIVSPQFKKLTVPTGWDNWSHGYAGPVFWSNFNDTATLTLPPNTRAFQFWAEPNLYGTFAVTATTDAGISSCPVTVTSPGGATGFGFYSEQGDAINTITIVTSGTLGYAIGEFSIAQWPNFASTGTDEPPPGVCGYGLTPFDQAAQAAIPDLSPVTTIPGSPLPGNLTSSETLSKYTVPSSWATWSHQYAGPVFYRNGISTTLTLPPETGAFLFYVEPNAFGTVNVIVTTETGMSAPATPVSGTGGAMGFAFCSQTGEALAAVTIALPPGSAGFAIGEFSIARRPFTSVFNDECPYARAAAYRPFLNQQTVDAATQGATDPIPACGNGNRHRSVWYQYTPDLSGILTATTHDSAYDTILEAFTGPCDALTPVPGACNDDVAPGSDLTSQITFSADAGTRYLFYVSAYQPYGMGRLNFGLDLVPCVLTNCNATVPSGAMAGTSVDFQGSVTTVPGSCGTASYDWDFGDGTAHGTGANPSHTYAAAGTYPWTMTATENGANCSQSGTIVICSLSCSASASPTAGLAPLPVSFTSSVTPSSPACTGTVVYDWDFGDGTAHSSAANITHTYATAGTYAWTLTVTFSGVTCTQAGSITVCGLSCSASASASAGFAPLSVSFTGSGTVSGGCGGAVTYDWDFGDGTAHSSQQSPSHTYTSVGTYTWVMTVTSGGRTCTQTGTVYVCSVTCTGTASVSSGIVPLAVNFTSSATPTYPACSGSVTYDWNFGDGTAHSSQQNPSHTYTTAGTYTWTVTVNVGGATCSKTGAITACGLACSATATPASGFAPLSVAFSGNGNITGPCSGSVSYDWNFGDGSAHSASQTPSHTYSAAGTYTWTMTVSAAGATCTQTGTITVCTLTCAAAVPATGQTGTPVAFSATAGGGSCSGPMTYQWSFGDGSTGSGQSVQHLYSAAGAYNWSVVVTSGGASCTKTGSITVVVPPVVTLVKKSSPPFTIVVTGSNFQSTIKAFINGTEWTSVTYKSTTKIKLTGGASLKAVVPKGVPTNFTFVNPDGGTATVTGWTW